MSGVDHTLGGEREGLGARLLRLVRRRPAKNPATIIVPQLLEPLSAERIADELTRRSYRFSVDDDGDLTGTWDGHRFWFLLMGEDKEILQVRGRWNGAVNPRMRSAVLQAVNDWNRERLWPKAYVREEAHGLSVYGEVSVDFEHGVTDEQLAATIACGLVAGTQFFESLRALGPVEGAA